MKYAESDEQISLVTYCDIKGYPYNLIFSIENEGMGKRSYQAMARSKAMGKRSGVSDLFLPVKRGGYGGLFIEMKSKEGRLTDNQKEFQDKMLREGYVAITCYSAQDAIQFVEHYLSNKSIGADHD